MDVEYIEQEPGIAALLEMLEDEEAAERAFLLTRLAWHLRQRDTGRALVLATQADALLPAEGQCIDPHERSARARLRLVQAEAAWLEGRLAQAGDDARSAMRVFDDLRDARGAGDAEFLLSLVCRDLGDQATASQLIEQAGARFAVVDDRVRLAVSQLWQAALESSVDPEAAMARAARVLDRPDLPVHPAVQGLAHLCNGISARVRGEVAVAIQHLPQSLEMLMSAGQRRWALTAAVELCIAHGNMGDFAIGLGHLEQALAIAKDARWPVPAGWLMSYVGITLMVMGRGEQACLDIMDEARAVLAPFRESQEWIDHCSYAGQVFAKANRHEAALESFAAAEKGAQRAGRIVLAARSRSQQAGVLSKQGLVDEAIAAMEEALRLCDKGESSSGTVVQMLQMYAQIAQRHALPCPAGSKAPSSSAHYLERAVELVEKGKGSAAGITLEPEFLSQLAREYAQAGDHERAYRYEHMACENSNRRHARQSANAAAVAQVRYETERAKAQASHHHALAEVEARRAELESLRADAEARRADAELQAHRAKSSFIANMSHELRSPLNAMLGFSRLLLRNTSLDETARHDMAIVLSSGEHLYALVNQVLDLSKIEAGRATLLPVPCDLYALLDELEDSFTLAARGKGLRLTIEADDNVPGQVEVDATKLRQVLANLLANAIKFTPAGRVTLRVQVEGDDHCRLRFAVSDTGVGIAAEELAQLGQAFAQAQAGRQAVEGTGLGLAISRSFVQLMGSELVLQSQPGQGTLAAFAIQVRLLEAREAQRPAASPRIVRLAPGTRPPRILVADDLLEGRQLLRRLLEPLGFEVREACNGREATQVWEQWQPDLICMDMRMPVMDGREATRRVKASAKGRETIVIALTASSFEEQREEILAAGCDDFLRKPFEEDALLELIARHIKVEYERETPPPKSRRPPADLARLAAVPRVLRERLRAALLTLDVNAIGQAMQAMRDADEEQAAILTALVDRFDFERLREILERVDERTSEA